MIYSKIEFIIFIEVVGFVVRIEQLKYFIEIAKCQSIKGASENLFLTQQSLSQTIKNLEKELGFFIAKSNARWHYINKRRTIVCCICSKGVR